MRKIPAQLLSAISFRRNLATTPGDQVDLLGTSRSLPLPIQSSLNGDDGGWNGDCCHRRPSSSASTAALAPEGLWSRARSLQRTYRAGRSWGRSFRVIGGAVEGLERKSPII